MPLLENGKPIDDHFVFVLDNEPLPANGSVLVPLERWRRDRGQLFATGNPVGVQLKSHQLVSEIAGDLPHLTLVALEMPKFRDGRAFSAARELRERYGFAGEIRAVGHIIPDQYVFLLRTGVSTVAVPEARFTEAWAAALREFSVVYQPGAYCPKQTGDSPLSGLRRHLVVGGGSGGGAQ